MGFRFTVHRLTNARPRAFHRLLKKARLMIRARHGKKEEDMTGATGRNKVRPWNSRRTCRFQMVWTGSIVEQAGTEQQRLRGERQAWGGDETVEAWMKRWSHSEARARIEQPCPGCSEQTLWPMSALLANLPSASEMALWTPGWPVPSTFHNPADEAKTEHGRQERGRRTET